MKFNSGNPVLDETLEFILRDIRADEKRKRKIYSVCVLSSFLILKLLGL